MSIRLKCFQCSNEHFQNILKTGDGGLNLIVCAQSVIGVENELAGELKRKGEREREGEKERER